MSPLETTTEELLEKPLTKKSQISEADRPWTVKADGLHHYSYSPFNKQGGVRLLVEKELLVKRIPNPENGKQITETIEGVKSWWTEIESPPELKGNKIWVGQRLGKKGLL